MSRTLVSWTISLGLASFTAGAAHASDDASKAHAGREARAEAERQFLRGTEPGSLARPKILATDADVAALCSALDGPRRRIDGDAVYTAPKKKELRARRSEALRGVYQVTVAPGAFRAGTYDPDDAVLPLAVDHGIVALQGALTLQIMDRRDAELAMPPQDAARLAKQIESKALSLVVTFRPERDGADELSPCFSPAKSAAWVLRVVPLAYALVEPATAKQVASVTTEARRELDRFVDPGPAELVTSVELEGGADPSAFARALDAERPKLATCLEAVMSSAGETGVLGFGATTTPAGGLVDVRVEVEAVDAPSARDCVARIIEALVVPRSSKPVKLHVTVGVERVPAEAEAPLGVGPVD
ncbi:hypothetical protein L6R52_34150 [Myxococcota bacterium]|nr:hypothetical protein [Myxococcota bacterium]